MFRGFKTWQLYSVVKIRIFSFLSNNSGFIFKSGNYPQTPQPGAFGHESKIRIKTLGGTTVFFYFRPSNSPTALFPQTRINALYRKNLPPSAHLLHAHPRTPLLLAGLRQTRLRHRRRKYLHGLYAQRRPWPWIRLDRRRRKGRRLHFLVMDTDRRPVL